MLIRVTLCFALTIAGALSQPSELSNIQKRLIYKRLFNNEVLSPHSQSNKPIISRLAVRNLSIFVKFYLYTTKNNSTAHQLWNNDLNSLKTSHFDSSKKTVIVIHGYMNNLNSDMIQVTKNNILAIEDCNVIAVDWSLLTDTIFYHIVALETPGVGRFIGDFISFLSTNGLDLKNVHLIGHSLGAQAAGFAGKQLNGKIFRISGLEPALPGFIATDKDSRLDAGDANYVDCIHTCSGMLGFKDPICQADYYPNGGLDPQPGCTWLDFGTCSHGRSHQLYAESILKGHIFNALACQEIPSASPAGCVDKGAIMGYTANSQYKGIFYVSTNAAFPFSTNVSQ